MVSFYIAVLAKPFEAHIIPSEKKSEDDLLQVQPRSL